MTRVTTRDVVLFAVLLALCTSVAAPASAVAIGDGDSETTLGDGLESDDSSSGGLTDSSDDSDSDDSDSDDTDSDDSTNESSDDGSTNESSDESSSDTNDDGSTSDSGSLSNWSSNESTPDDSNSSRSGTTDSDGDVENRTLAASPEPVDATHDVSAGVLEALKHDLLRTLALEDATGTVESTATGDDGSTTSDDTTDVDDETETVSSSLDALVDGTSGIIVGLSASITGADADGAPPRVDGDRSADAGSGTPTAAGTGASGAGANGPLPSDSARGVAVGVGALAVAGVVRHGSVVPSGVAGLGSTLAAGLAPVVGRSSALDRLVRTLAPFRYSRYDDSDPLEHEARADVYEVVHGAPGAYLSKVADRADLPLSTARHHIRVLEREDLVSGAKVRGKRRFYPAYTSGIELAAALDDEATAAVIDAVARFGSASVSDLAEELDRDPSTVSHHLSRLAEDGIVVRERDGRAVNNRLSPEARTALEPERETDVVEVGEALASD